MGFEELLGVNPWTALFTLLNTLAIFFVAKKFLFKPVTDMIHSRQKEIEDAYAKADEAKAQAKSLQTEYEEKLAAASQTSERLVKEAVERGQAREDEIIRKAKADAEAIREKANADAVMEKKKALGEAKDTLSDIAVEIAEKVVGRNIDEKDQSSLVDRFIEELGEQV